MGVGWGRLQGKQEAGAGEQATFVTPKRPSKLSFQSLGQF
jgi:hypothetical protein